MLIKLKYLPLLLVLIGEIVCAQPTALNKPDSCIVPLTCPEFDFYAQALVERNGLRNDTALAGEQLKAQFLQIKQFFSLLAEDSLATKTNQKIIDTYAQSLQKVNKQYVKEQRKSKRRGVVALVFAVVTGVLTLITILN